VHQHRRISTDETYCALPVCRSVALLLPDFVLDLESRIYICLETLLSHGILISYVNIILIFSMNCIFFAVVLPRQQRWLLVNLIFSLHFELAMFTVQAELSFSK